MTLATSPTSLTQWIPQYLYQEYADDDALQAFVMAYNEMGQSYLDWFNSVNLPVYTGLSGSLLDWVANGLYDQYRPVFLNAGNRVFAAYATAFYAQRLPYAGRRTNAGQIPYSVASDDIFKRCMTWNLYKGDGMVMTTQWLKRRVARFLNSINGQAQPQLDLYSIGVTYSGHAVTITIPDLPASAVFEEALTSRALQFPFQFTVTVVIA